MKRIFTFFIISNLFVISALAQSNFSISGIVKDNDTKQVMEYATVSLYNTSDSSLVTGLVTNLEGKFTLDNLKPGNYYVDVSFIGFKSKKIGNLVLSPSNPKIVLPVTYLGADADVIGEVEVTAIKQSVKYELDKKVVDVDKNIAASSGTAADVLATVPSVQTDIDGNVSLRGSSNFKVFINGRPSVLDANDALQQIPASTIENIEIITNPSAKYDAEGTGGIINIITKKQKLEGFSGIINVRGGIWDTYGGDATLSYRKKRFTFLIVGKL
ncbi:MAG: TonB-dependent receptor [Chitinophagales bacterium]